VEIVLEAGGGCDFQYPGRRVAGVPERVPLLARLEDQVPRIADHHGIPEHRRDAAFEHEAVFVLAMVSMHGGRQGAWMHGMLDEREPFRSVIIFDEEAGVGSSQLDERTIVRTYNYNSWRRHASSPSDLLVRARPRPTGTRGEDRRAAGDRTELASRKFPRHRKLPFAGLSREDQR
jgi:hypothetical protein